ncbi:MAG: hypothetical protein GY807_02190 [Gammaproteobacteria bacterium]|nr:hypothetical protein [Gammaproteobacteria bacterium]
MLTSTYDNRPRQKLHGLPSGKIGIIERGTVYRTGTDERGRPVEVTLPSIEFRAVE